MQQYRKNGIFPIIGALLRLEFAIRPEIYDNGSSGWLHQIRNLISVQTLPEEIPWKPLSISELGCQMFVCRDALFQSVFEIIII